MPAPRYRAFISYSHRDTQWATWLHRSLESYRPPKHLIGQPTPHGPVPARLAPIFRDREELPSATDLGSFLRAALERSECQIVICSPAAARSKWVNEEILAFKRLGREARVFCLIIGGEPNASDIPGREDEECFPPAVRYQLAPDGTLSDQRAEPIAADARAAKDGKANAKIKLIAGLLGVGFDALKQRELTRRNRRLAAIAAASITGMMVTTGLAVSALLARADAVAQRARAEIEAETARQTASFMVDLFRVSDPSEALGNTITAREILDKGAVRIEQELSGQPTIQATLMETIGTVYTSLGLYDPAASLLESALDKRRAIYGTDHLEVAHSLDRLGEVLKLKAEYPKAEQMFRSALTIQRNALGEENAGTARILYELADLLGRMGEFKQAEPLFREALDLRRRLLGENSAEVAQSIEGLALNLHDQGNYKDPVDLMRQTVALLRNVHGGPHPDLAEALNNLGFVLLELGEYRESELLYREALEMKRFLLGDAHPEIAMGMNNVAFALHDQGQHDAAEVMYRGSIEMQRKLLGESHPEVALTLNNLAFLQYDKGDLESALATSRESLDMFRRTVGDEHPSVANGMANLGIWLMQAGDYASAESSLRDSLELRKRLLGSEHRDAAGSMTLLADLLIDTKRFEEARPMAAEAKAIFAKALGPDHWRTAAAASAEGAALAGLERYEEAEALLSESFAVLRDDPGALPIYVRNATRWMVALYTGLGDPDEAAKYVAMLSTER
jgi:tetratricopeptide (TPR) repeat protein